MVCTIRMKLRLTWELKADVESSDKSEDMQQHPINWYQKGQGKSTRITIR